MTRRHKALVPLAHDHHHALHNARSLRLASDGDASARADAASAFLQFFKTESVRHFREEEEVVFPLIALKDDAPMEGITRVVTEHVIIHALVQELEGQVADGDADSETMRRLAELLKTHVRFEEDELFPRIESCAAGDLNDVQLKDRPDRQGS